MSDGRQRVVTASPSNSGEQFVVGVNEKLSQCKKTGTGIIQSCDLSVAYVTRDNIVEKPRFLAYKIVSMLVLA